MHARLSDFLGPRFIQATEKDTLKKVGFNVWFLTGCHASKDGKYTVLTYDKTKDVTVLESPEHILNSILGGLHVLEEDGFEVFGGGRLLGLS